MSNKIIVDLTEVYEIKKRKQEELAYYQEQLEALQQKMYWVTHEIKVTETIIFMIEEEMIVDVGREVKKIK
jgi:prefoldin subunit 5